MSINLNLEDYVLKADCRYCKERTEYQRENIEESVMLQSNDELYCVQCGFVRLYGGLKDKLFLRKDV